MPMELAFVVPVLRKGEREGGISDVLEPPAPTAVVAPIGAFYCEVFLEPFKTVEARPVDRVRMALRAAERRFFSQGRGARRHNFLRSVLN